MDKIKKGLGRGLSSLIGETKIEPKKNQLPISDLVPNNCLLYTSPSPRDLSTSRMPSSA